jgi:hypothetical protein
MYSWATVFTSKENLSDGYKAIGSSVSADYDPKWITASLYAVHPDYFIKLPTGNPIDNQYDDLIRSSNLLKDTSVFQGGRQLANSKGTRGGWTITPTAITKSNTSLGSDGSITAGAAGQFTVSAAGALGATGATISGTIKAVSGFIGSTNGVSATGFNFNATQITSVGAPAGTTQIILDGSTGTISGGLISGAIVRGSVLETATSGTYVKIDGPSKPGTIQLFANGFSTAGLIDVSGSWSETGTTIGQLVITPPIAAGETGPSIEMYSSDTGGFAWIKSDTVILGDSASATSGGRMDGTWSIYNTDNSTTGSSAATRSLVRNISAWQGSGPPSGSTFVLSQVGDIVLFYT